MVLEVALSQREQDAVLDLLRGAQAKASRPAPAAATDRERRLQEALAEDKAARQRERDKAALMKMEVKPQMAAVFKGFDAEVFKAVGCKTCHGKNPKAVGFAMPSPDLPKLDPTDGFKAHKASDPKITEFMMRTVRPKMVEILGVEAWSPKNPKGFGCFSCHTRAGG